MKILAVIVVASWLLVFWRAGTSEDSGAGPGFTLTAIVASLLLGLLTLSR